MKSWPLVLAMVFVISCSPSRDERVEKMRILQANSRTDETLYPLWDLVREFPDDVEINSLYGQALLESNIPSHAIWPLRKAAEDPEASIEDYLRLGQALHASGASNEALAVAQEVIAVERDNLKGLMLHSEIAVELNRWEELLDSSERLIGLNPGQRPMAYVWRAQALAGLERFPEAYEVLDQGREAFGRYSNAADLNATFCLEAAKIAMGQANLDGRELSALEAAKLAAGASELAAYGPQPTPASPISPFGSAS